MRSVKRRCGRATILAAIALFALSNADVQSAGYRMCAFRDGPKGPCTCKTDTDGPGNFTVVDASRCRKTETPAAAAGAQPAAVPGAEPPAAPVGAAVPPAAPAPAATAPPAETPPAPAPPPGATETAAPQVTPTASPPAAPPAAEKPAAVAVTVPAAGPRPASKLEEVRARGRLLCGVNPGLIGFSAQTASGDWAGLDVDFCRAVAAAALSDASKFELVPLETNARFDALRAGKVDLLSRNTTWTMDRETELGIAFAGVLYFDGQGFLAGDERGLVSAQQLTGMIVCVEAGTTSERNMAYYFKAQQIAAETKTFAAREEMLKAYASGACDAYTGDRSALYSDRATFATPTAHVILPEVISKEPLAPAVLDGDREWASIVRWTLAGLINAEEVGLDKASAAAPGPLADDAARLVDGAGRSGEKLRLARSWLRDVVAAGGNYGELFEANLGRSSSLGMTRGINALWKRGGILYAPPMW